MRLELILPSWQRAKWPKRIYPSHLSLPVLAALTPPDVEVSITEEEIEDVIYKDDVDLVGISFMTPFANRAYEIGDEYKRRGIKVVLGGIHATALPSEAIKHADSVVIGEAENVWNQVIQDFKKNWLKKFYKSDEPADLGEMPNPRRELSGKKAAFSLLSVQTSRGCPFSCEFCCVTDFFGGKFRSRPIKEVIEEIEISDNRNWIIVDDNIIGNQEYAKKLFRELAALKIRWVGQSSLLIANNQELLKLAAKSGCFGLFIGFESLSQDNLNTMGKHFNRVDKYEDNVKKIYDSGIVIQASFIFGFDHDDHGVFERTVAFLKKNKIFTASLCILTPFPGTKLFERLKKEGRIVTQDWSKYDYRTAVFSPKLMTPQELEEGVQWACKQFYSVPSIFSRFPRNWRHPLEYFMMNWSYRTKNKLKIWNWP